MPIDAGVEMFKFYLNSQCTSQSFISNKQALNWYGLGRLLPFFPLAILARDG